MKKTQPKAFEVPQVTTKPAKDFNPAPYNPTKVNPKKIEGIKRSIREHGFVDPLVVQLKSEKHGPMVLIGGHQRLRAVRELCIDENLPTPDLPCIVLDVPDRKAKKLNIALNGLRGGFDGKRLSEVIVSIQQEEPITADETIELGFEEEELSKYLHLADPPKVYEEEVPVFGRTVTLSLEFSDTKTRDAVKDKLQQRAKVESRSTGEVVMGLLGDKRTI